MNPRLPNPLHPLGRNSTIKQQEQPNNNNNLENDSSISLREGADVHYYDLDYSDEQKNNDIVSSSDQQGRQITHEEFMQMISTNMQRKSKSSHGVNSDQSQQYHEDDDNYDNQHEIEEQRRFERKRPYPKKYPLSNDFKHAYYQHNRKKQSPSTRDKSHNFYQYAHKHRQNQRNDPQKSNQAQKRIKQTKEASFNDQNSVNTVKQFRIDSFSYGHTFINQKSKSKAWKQYKQMKLGSKAQPAQIDQSFSLITLPQYDEQSLSQPSVEKKPSYMIEKNNQNQVKRLSKYKNVAQLQGNQETAYDKLNWRYQEAKLRFIDSFLPDSMKIGNNGYNMLKYMARKNDLTFNILKVL